MTAASVHFDRRAEAHDSAGDVFHRDVVAGLSARPKRLAPKYFYDKTGSRLFDAICELPEYYLTRVELEILRAHVDELAGHLGDRVRVIEPGAGSGIKTRLLLKALGPERCIDYVPVDIAREHVADVTTQLASELPWLRVRPIVSDFTRELPLRALEAAGHTLVYFPGSTIGNFDPAEAAALLVQFRKMAGAGGAIVVGVDLKKDPRVLHAAYNDAQGVTAAFNRNLLVRMNRELAADFELDSFAHYAFFDPKAGRVEMHLVSTRRQTVNVGGHRVHFEKGESIHTECSYKYDLPGVERLARDAGLALAFAWLDRARRFAIVLLRPIC